MVVGRGRGGKCKSRRETDVSPYFDLVISDSREVGHAREKRGW